MMEVKWVKKIKYSDFTKEQLERIRLSEKQFKEGKYKTLEEIKRKVGVEKVNEKVLYKI